MLVDLIALICAASIGFAAHRASLCNVRAVAEVMTAGSAHMLWSLLQAVLWMVTLTGALVLIFGLQPQTAGVRAPLAWASLGGFLFGMGAAANGGCSLSTLTRLADGDVGMSATLVGFVLGVNLWLGVLPTDWPPALVPVPSPWLRWPQWAPGILTLLLAWAVQRLLMLWRLLRKARTLEALVLAPSYHLSAAAALLGLAGGLLYATQGAWSYTSYLRMSILSIMGAAAAPSIWHGVLVLGLVGGMVASARRRKSFGWRRPDHVIGWMRHAAGGCLMGAGAALIPGGNDTLLLGHLPAMTFAALSAYLAMLVGIGLVLALLRAAHIPMPRLSCSPSGCDELRPAVTASDPS